MELIDFLNQNDRFAAMAGVQVVEMGQGCAKAVMTVVDHHLNGAGVCQGGALFTLADLAFAAAVNSGVTNSPPWPTRILITKCLSAR